MSHRQPAFDYGYGVPGMPMPACATDERVVFSSIDQNKETNKRKQRQRRGFQDNW
jgi:hypothetical protein